jgi:thiol-disulfide isomerase/thioredoxin
MRISLSARRAWVAVGIFAALGSTVAWSLGGARAQDAAVAEPENEAAVAEPLDLTIPEGDFGEIDTFIQKIATSESQGDTDEAQLADAKKKLGVILEATDRMEALIKAADKPDPDQAILAERYRLMALQGLSQLGDEDAVKRFAAEVAKAMNDERPEIASVGWQSYLIQKLSAWDSLDQAAKDEVAKKIADRVNSPTVGSLEVSIVQLIASNLDHMDDEFAAKVIEATLPVFQKSEAEDVKVALADANLEGMLRRFKLLGNPMELEGDVLGGGTFDWKSYRGKVVLVDFSATWCRPCVEEAPNVLRMYNLFKGKGFDVVAVSLDQTPEAAEEYVKANGIKWTTLFPKNEDDRYWNHPLVKYYGVTGIPTAILLDKDGKAVNMNARGPILRDELVRLLGAPAEQAEAPANDAAAAPGAEGAAG